MELTLPKHRDDVGGMALAMLGPKPKVYCLLHNERGAFYLYPAEKEEQRWLRAELVEMKTCRHEGFPKHPYCGICPDHEVPRTKCECALEYTESAQEMVLALRGERE